MNRVRNDILNGWKEIGGYVSRDIRTVERWEKQRGLPVRRVPGSGRATVYALIPELDEWLARSKPDEAEEAAPPPDISVHHSAPLPTPEALLLEEEPVEAAPVVSELIPEAQPNPPVVQPVRRRWMVASVGIAAAAAVLCAIAWPRMVQARHARPMEKLPHYNLDDARSSPSVPYRSQVAGVDELYLRGVYFYEERTPDSLQRSLQDFSDAIAKDPNYAPAYAGLSNAYNLMREYSRMSNEEAFPKAKAAAEHAIALDPTLPQAHASLGFIDFFWSWDAAAAESEFQTALALDPNSVLAHHWYGSMLTHQGRYDEALEQLNIAQRLQPTSVAIMSVRALALGLSGHRDDATEMLQEVLRDAPGATSPHTILSTLSLVEPRDLPRYLDETTRVAELRHDEDLAQVIAAARTAYRARGETAMWTTILNEDAKRHPRKEDRTFQMAQAHAALGRYDDALDDLSAMATRHDVSLVGLDVDPTLRPMYSDPRFTRLAATLGIPAKTPAR